MGELLGFFGRHIIASLVGTVGVIFYIVGMAEQAEAIATRFKPWHWQSLGAAFFVIFVVLVLLSYDKEHAARVAAVAKEPMGSAPLPVGPMLLEAPRETESLPPPALIAPPRGPEVLPISVSDAYLALFTENATQLRKNRFLREYAGKQLELDLPLVHVERQKSCLRVQFRGDEGGSDSIFVDFPLEWEDHLLEKAVLDQVHFCAKIVEGHNGNYRLQDAALI